MVVKKRKAADPSDLAAVLRQAIEMSDLTHYRIAKSAGLSTDQVSRFVSGETPDIRISTATKLAGVFGLELRKVGQ